MEKILLIQKQNYKYTYKEVEAVMEENREWKVNLLGKELQDWNIQMLR